MEDGAETPVQQPAPAVQQAAPVVQQPVTVDPAVLLEMVRAMVREMVVPPQADAGSAPIAQPVPAPAPAVQTPTVEVRSEGHVDWVKVVGQCRPPFFYGGRDDDIELWFREIEGVFDMVAVPEDVRYRLAAGLLRKDAFDSWTI